MKWIIKYFKKMSKKWRTVLMLVVPILLLLIYFLLKLFSVSDSEIALAELQKSYTNDSICHGKCAIWRRERELIIVKDLKDKPERLLKRIEYYWSALPDDSEFKIEVVQIMFLAYGEDNPPVFIKNYVDSQTANLSLLREIIIRFNSLAVNNRRLSSNLTQLIKTSSSSEIKIEAVKTLKEINNDGEIENFFQILATNSDLDLKLEVIKNISNIRDKTDVYTLEQLEIIRTIVINPDSEINFRQSLVQLIGDYYLIYPEESRDIWQDVYDNPALDNISRNFSGDYLNHLSNMNLDLPSVSENEWEDYYNQ